MTGPHARRLLLAAFFIAGVFVALGVGSMANAQGEDPPEPVHWSEATNAELESCDDLYDTDPDAALYCVTRYTAAAAGLWTDSSGPEFADALPLLSVVAVFGIGLTLGNAVYRS